jgi:hypothetical protein
VNQRFKARFKMDNVDDQIDTVTRSTMALTVSCARCHDHKFDPIPTTDYYALAGIFTSTVDAAGLGSRMGGAACSTTSRSSSDTSAQRRECARHPRPRSTNSRRRSMQPRRLDASMRNMKQSYQEKSRNKPTSSQRATSSSVLTASATSSSSSEELKLTATTWANLATAYIACTMARSVTPRFAFAAWKSAMDLPSSRVPFADQPFECATRFLPDHSGRLELAEWITVLKIRSPRGCM